MSVEIVEVKENEVTIKVKIPLKGSLLDCEESILKGVNEVGSIATGEAIKLFDTDGSSIKVGDIKLTARNQDYTSYQTPYGVVRLKRHVYQSARGGRIYRPLEEKARIIQGATPRFAKLLSHKYANLAAPAVRDDLETNHGRKVTISYLQRVVDHIGSIAQAKEEEWEYTPPDLGESVSTVGISLDGAHILTKEDGYREGMVGTISLYDKYGERLHTTYVAASPEYGKATFFERLEREIMRTKNIYPDAQTIGIADGAKNNWPFLNKHTEKQVLDYWHASEYLAKASHGIFNKKSQEAKRKIWLKDRCHNLKHEQGAAAEILETMEKKITTSKALSKIAQENLESAISYFSNNIEADRMNYHKFEEDNLPIGSGVTEAACKTIIKQRLCGSGMRWKERGLRTILSLRTLVHTQGRWKQFWEKINQYGVAATV